MTRPFAAVLLLALGAPACVAGAVRPLADSRVTGVSPTLALSTYYEDGTQVAIIVGVRPTLSRRKRPYIPFEIAVVNKGLATFTLTPESFTLIDAQNNRYPVVGSDELSRGYGSTDLDRRLGEVESILHRKYAQYDRVPSNFTPGFNAPVGSRQIVLHRFSYLVDMLYFPNPSVPTPVGPYELLVQVPEMQDPLVLRFMVGHETR